MTLETLPLRETFLAEYSDDGMIARYISRTARPGVAYALSNVYGPVYSRIARSLIATRPRGHRFRVLEYGCGGGMNLLKIVEVLSQQGADVETAIGADFSPRMIDAARQDAAQNFPRHFREKIQFLVAHNESLAADLAQQLQTSPAALERSFDIVVGVNTFRYCHRLSKAPECARDIFRLLSPGGYSIMIDMNARFPLFRSRLSNIFRQETPDCYLPTLGEYTRPFQQAGFRILESRNFCWVPHSATPRLVAVCRMLTPVLDRCLSSFAMRSLVIAQRPA